MADKTIAIPVPGGLMVHGKVLPAVTLKEPSYDTYLTLGEPVTYVSLGEGRFTSTENEQTIRDYIAACLVEPNDSLLLEPGGYRLARALKGAVLNFFRDDDTATERSTTSPQTSSSDAAKDDSPPAT